MRNGKIQRRAAKLKNTKESNRDCKSYGTIDLSLLRFSFHSFTHGEIKLFRHHKFLLQYWYVEQTENNNYEFFAKVPLNIFKACLNLMC